MESYVKGKIPQIIFGSKSAQKVSGLLKKYEIKKCLLVTGHHVVRHSITQNVIKALSVEGIHCDVFDRVTPEPTDTVAGFKDIRTGKIEEIMLIRSPEDLEKFKEIYEITEEISKEY